LLMSGKSATMSFMMACSSTGQFCHDGSCRWQRRMRLPGRCPRSAAPQKLRRASLRPSPRRGLAAAAGSTRSAGRRPAARRKMSRIRRKLSAPRQNAPPRGRPHRRCACVARDLQFGVGRKRVVAAQVLTLPLARPAMPVSPVAPPVRGGDAPVVMKRSCRPACSLQKCQTGP
jgi:hypothetical protein